MVPLSLRCRAQGRRGMADLIRTLAVVLGTWVAVSFFTVALLIYLFELERWFTGDPR